MIRTISAYDARVNFGDILNQVYYQGMEIIVTKTGKPMVKIVKADEAKSQKQTDGLWSKMRVIAKRGKRADLVAFVRKDRDREHLLRT